MNKFLLILLLIPSYILYTCFMICNKILWLFALSVATLFICIVYLLVPGLYNYLDDRVYTLFASWESTFIQDKKLKTFPIKAYFKSGG